MKLDGTNTEELLSNAKIRSPEPSLRLHINYSHTLGIQRDLVVQLPIQWYCTNLNFQQENKKGVFIRISSNSDDLNLYNAS